LAKLPLTLIICTNQTLVDNNETCLNKAVEQNIMQITTQPLVIVYTYFITCLIFVEVTLWFHVLYSVQNWWIMILWTL